MSFDTEVSRLRQSANPVLLNRIIDACPTAEDIEPWHNLDALLWPDLSENEQTRREQIPSVLDEYQDELRRYIRRFYDMRARRLDALSNYDIGIAYRGIGPERGLASALQAVANHIGRTRAQILWLLGEQDRLRLPQLALF
jgi:hypothetical protein